MGGGSYSADVARLSRSSNQDVFSYQGYGTDAQRATERRDVHPVLNIKGKIRECVNETPIVVALDITRSRGDDTKVVYEKLPMLMGQIEMKGYVQGPALSFAAVGDANSDEAPLQVGQFEADNRLDDVLSKVWIEEGGGGTGQETYELAAYYFARHTKIEAAEKGRKGYFFFVGDEGFYPTVEKRHIKSVLGFDVEADVDSGLIFQELQEKFHVFFIYPQKSWEQRKSDIDAEIKQRVEMAGGQYQNVDVRASLIWDNRNDLDLHLVVPSGEEIFYDHKKSKCGGWLDVDMNVQGESLKPVENIRWAKGTAPAGHYKVIVQNYKFHEPDEKPTNFRLEVEVNGQVEHYDGTISQKGEIGGRSNVTVCEFDCDPASRGENSGDKESLYSGYDDATIKEQWSQVIPPQNMLFIDDPGTILDVMLGAMSLVEGTVELGDYIEDVKARGDLGGKQLEQTRHALERLAGESGIAGGIDLPESGGGADRSGGTRRL